MEEKNLSEKESLAIISRMISTVKNDYWQSGTGPILWGLTNAICFILSYGESEWKGFKVPFNPFYLMIFTFVLQIYLDRKEKKYKAVSSFTDDVHKHIWTAFAISVVILTFGSGITNTGYQVFPPLIILFAIPTYASGQINKFLPFILAGILCWILALSSFFFKGPILFLFAAFAAIIAWVIPGFILKVRFMRKRKLSYGV